MEIVKGFEKKKKVINYEDEFNRQLKEFKDADHSSEYEGVDFDDEVYLVRVFEMDTKKVGGATTLKFGVSPITGEFKPVDDISYTKITPIVKVIRVGKGVDNNKGYKVGDLIMVASTDVIGDAWNPEFLQTLQFMENKGRKPIIPDNMRQRIPNIEVRWDHYKYVRPWVLESTKEDNLTYLLPALAIKGEYNRL